MTEIESFAVAARQRALQCGLTEVEIDEAAGALIETPALREVSCAVGSALVIGDPGTGKTLAACRWLMRPVYDLRSWYLSDSDWVPRIRNPFPWLFRTAKSLSRVAQYDEKSVEPLFSAARLVLDDLGQEYLDKSGFLVSLIDEVVSERHRRRLPTVMTANLSAEDFAKRYGDRVVDRIVATGKLVVCVGGSLRRRSGGARTIPPLVTHEQLIERRTELAAEAAKLAADHAARLDAQERAWAETRSRAVELPTNLGSPRSPGRTRMTDAEVAARKAELARQVEELQARRATEKTP